MFEDLFNTLYEAEKEEFKRVCNYFLSKTFILREVFDKQSQKMMSTKEYRFIEKYPDLFENYLAISGWRMIKEPVNGIYKIESMYEYNKARFDSFSTYILLSLMLIYEEATPNTSYGNAVVTTTVDIVNKLTTLGVLSKKPSKELFRTAFRRIEGFNLILRLSSSTVDVDQWKIMILPTINQVVDYEKLKELCENMPGIVKETSEESLGGIANENVN